MTKREPHKEIRPRVAAYCRVSTDKDDQLLSLQTQKEFFEQYAIKNNLELVRLYADEGISGTKLKNRKDFNQMMKDAERGMFDKVFVKDVSRLSRNVVDFLQSIRRLKALNIECLFITSNMSLNDGELTLTILAAVAQEESANLSKRVKFGKKKNAEKGRVPNLVYGYDKSVGENFTLDKNTFEAEVVKRIFDMYISLGFGTNKIAQILNGEGITTKRGCKWTQNSIVRILSNQLYIGKVINGKEYVSDFLSGTRKKNDSDNWHIMDKPEFAIIKKEDFNKAQEILLNRYETFKLDKKRHSNQYPFSTLIKCECCGRSLRRIYRKYTNEYIRWSCSGRNANGIEFCNNRTIIDETELIEEIKDYLTGLVSSKEKLLEKTILEFKKKYQPSNLEDDEKVILKELNKYKKAKSKQIEMFEADIISMNELKIRSAEINNNIEKCENKLASLQGNTGMYDKLEATVKKYFGSINDVLSNDVIDNALLKKVIKKIVVNAEGEIRVYLKLFQDLELDDEPIL